MNSVCAECGLPLLWGGQSWVEHTEDWHLVHRKIWLRAIRRRLHEELVYRGLAQEAAKCDCTLLVWRVVMPTEVLHYKNVISGEFWDEEHPPFREAMLAEMGREVRDSIEAEYGVRPHPMRVKYRVFDERGK